jgi:hypothetical protein
MNKSYVEEICLCFYVAYSVIILKNYHTETLVCYMDNNTESYIILQLTIS